MKKSTCGYHATDYKCLIKCLIFAHLLILLISVLGGGWEMPRVEAATENAWVEGTIISVRGNILVLRPQWRPKPKRVAFDNRTEITMDERTSRRALKPGLCINLGGPYSASEGVHVGWIEITGIPSASTTAKPVGLSLNKEGTYANASGTLKSVDPPAFIDDKGQPVKVDFSQLHGIWRLIRGDRNVLLIGTRVEVAGQDMPDDVLKATQIYPSRGQSPFGTMFGTIRAVKGNQILIRPRFTADTLAVTLKPGCRFMRQVTLPESAIKLGQQVTFWGEQRSQSGRLELLSGEKASDLKALALLIGDNRWPSAQGENAPHYWTGRLIALDPIVQLKLPNSQIIHILPTAQMPIARLDSVTAESLRVGQDAMFVLSRRNNGGFETSHIILDASPWVGYGG